jgi:SAM-dependent methyltransferase
MNQQFDAYRETYVDAVDHAIDFSGRDHAFFTRAKARHLLEIIHDTIGPPSTVRALDVGCGPGETDAYLTPHLRNLDGIDVSTELIERARAANPDATYTAYDGTTLPYDDGAFDFAFAICVVHHVPPEHWQRFVGEMARVVRDGGVVAIGEHNPFNPLTRLAVHRCEFDEDAVLLNRKTAEKIQRDVGLQPLESRYILFAPWEHRFVERVERRLRGVALGAQYIAVARRTRGYSPLPW